ncbi:MAG: D-alanine--D-alanine ligase, partial [Candidatus Moranbacteria bacterium]|nr:D-alanine--D-alanine ligase [Candidatus Moranbacteria bacterium]
MKNKKIKLAIIFGGRSAEHEVSVISARNIFKAIDKNKYDITLIGIDKNGNWLNFKQKELLKEDSEMFAKKDLSNLVIPFSKDEKFYLQIGNKNKNIEVVFPVLHGPLGEDGTIQGLFKLYNVPFVGPGVLGSAVAMDKDVAKRLFKEAGLPIGKFLVYNLTDKNKISFSEIKKYLGLPFFVKPANLGSSVGISKAKDEAALAIAVEEAFLYDEKVIIESFVDGREIECGVLGDISAAASRPGEIVPCNEFYDYRAKYVDDRSELVIPVALGLELEEKIKELSVKAFRAVEASGLARVDFFLDRNDGTITINEINTMPGFTSISMYPKMWEASGVSYND